MFELVVALDKISNNFEADQYGSLFNDLEAADGFKVTSASLLNRALLEAVYWFGQFTKRPQYILADLKLADVGYLGEGGRWAGTNSEIIESVCNTVPDVTHFTCHAFPGPVSVKEAVETAKHFGVGILIVTNMSHEGSRERMTFPDYFDYAIRIGEECGVEGYIVPGNDSAALSRAVEMTDK
jgi:orotidine-5'-phosphate decarboxylase